MDSPQQPGKQVSIYSTLRERILNHVIGRQRNIVLGAAAIMIVITVLEHIILARFGAFAHTALDLLVIIIIPVSVGALLQLLSTAAAGRDRAAQDHQANTELSQKLGEATSWDDLVTLIVAYPHKVAPQARVTLYVHRPGATRLEPEAQCERSGVVMLRPPVSISPDSLPVGSLPQLLSQRPRQGALEPPTHPPHRYDLPITRSDHTIAVLKLEYPPKAAPSPAELRAMQAAAPVMALALEVALLQDLAVEQAEASAEARQRIAQNLHDTLAQNVGYLRLKLDQLTGENAIHEIGVVLQELERMRAAADEAYGQVRQTLDELTPLPSGDLVSLLEPQAQVICNRAGLKLVTHQHGTPYPVPAPIRQQILLIAREALHNVEKHASAKVATITILWQANELILKITDDGAGFDFREVEVSTNGHYGLWIMQRRAAEIGGTLQVHTENGAGTEVTLWLPRSAAPISAFSTEAPKE